MRFWVAVEVVVAAVVDTKETTLTMTARRGMIVVVAEEEADAVDIVAVVEAEAEGGTRVIGRAITLMIIVRGWLVRAVVWIGYGKDGMIRI